MPNLNNKELLKYIQKWENRYINKAKFRKEIEQYKKDILVKTKTFKIK